jgi:hypothetical protein
MTFDPALMVFLALVISFLGTLSFVQFSRGLPFVGSALALIAIVLFGLGLRYFA